MTSKKKNFDGIAALAEMFKAMAEADREKMLVQLEKIDPKLVAAIRDQLFVFEDLLKLSEKSLQQLLQKIPNGKWVLALRNMPEEFREGIYKNLSKRAAQILKDEVDQQGPKRLSDIKSAQKEILEFAEGLFPKGKTAI